MNVNILDKNNYYLEITRLTCFVVFGTYEPTTISPPALSLSTPTSFGKIGGIGMIPTRAETKLAAVRHKKCFPLSSACNSQKEVTEKPSKCV